MPRGTDAPGYSLTLPGFAGPRPVPSRGFTRAAGPPDVAPSANPRGELAGPPGTTVAVASRAAPAEGTEGRTAPTPTPISAAAPAVAIHLRAPRAIAAQELSSRAQSLTWRCTTK